MLHDIPLTLRQINNKFGEDCLQLLTLEGDDFTQIKGLTDIANNILKVYPDIELVISSNGHDFGTYYGLEILNSSFEKHHDMESESFRIAEELGYDI